MICCNNAARNDPYQESHQPRCTPLDKLPDSSMKEARLKRFADSPEDVTWLNPDTDHSSASLAKDKSVRRRFAAPISSREIKLGPYYSGS